jgi:uncharacterized repeat protein (TIGR01451 family)
MASATPTGDTNGDARLDLAEVWTYTCTEVADQRDVEAGGASNTVTVTGRHARLGDVTSESTARYTIGRNPAIGLTKQADRTDGLVAGDKVVYTLAVSNTGDIGLANVTVGDPLCAPTPTGGDLSNPGVLDLSEVWTYTCTYAVTAADVEAGSVVNVATARGTGADKTVTTTATATVRTLQSPAIVVDKAATAAPGAGAGDQVRYTVVVRNGGNVPLSNLVVTDPLCTLVLQSGDANDDRVLQLTETWTYTCTYVLTQADVDAGKRDNTATGTGSWQGTVVSDTGDATVALQQAPALSLTKTPNPTSYRALGDVISYTYVVTNSGNTTLAGPFSVADDKASVSCPATAQLVVDASLTCTATHVITQADLDAGSVVNVATATNGTVTSPQVTARVERVEVLSSTPTATPTPSESPSQSPSGSPTPTPTPAPTATPSETPRVLPFVAPETSASPAPTAAASPSGTPAAAAPTTPRTLPFTGGAVLLPMLAFGSAALLVGALLVGTARRRPGTQ